MKRVTSLCLASLCFLLLPPRQSDGQLQGATAVPAAAVPQAGVPVARPVLLSAGLGTAGFFVGGLGGGLTYMGCDGDQCEVEAVLLGAKLGLAAGSALGAHVGNRLRGSFLLDVLAGVGAAAAGLGLSAILFEDNGSAFLLLIPIGQVASAVGVERTVSRRRARKLDLALSGADREAGLLLRVLP